MIGPRPFSDLSRPGSKKVGWSKGKSGAASRNEITCWVLGVNPNCTWVVSRTTRWRSGETKVDPFPQKTVEVELKDLGEIRYVMWFRELRDTKPHDVFLPDLLGDPREFGLLRATTLFLDPPDPSWETRASPVRQGGKTQHVVLWPPLFICARSSLPLRVHVPRA